MAIDYTTVDASKRSEVFVPDIEHDQSDTEGLARKLRDLEPQLTVRERRLLKRILAAAVLSGIVVGAADPATGTATGPVDQAATETSAAPGIDSIRAQFAAAFTPGEEWDTGPTDIGLTR